MKNLKQNKYSRKWVRDYLSSIIKKGALKVAFSWIGKKAAFLATGPLGWLATLVMNGLWDYFGDRVVRWSVKKGALVFDEIEGSIKALKIRKARDESGENYDNAVDDVFK